MFVSHEKEWNHPICDNINETQVMLSETSDRERQISYDITYMQNPKKKKKKKQKSETVECWLPRVSVGERERHYQRVQFSSVQLLSRVQLFVTPWTSAGQGSLSVTNTQSLLKLRSIELVTPSNHLILYRPLLLQPSIFPSIMVFSKESILHIRWPKY